MPDVIKQVIDATEIEDSRVYTGDYVNVAVAFKAVFGGQLVASYRDLVALKQQKPAHTAVEIGGTLYDRTGVTNHSALRERAYFTNRRVRWEDVRIEPLSMPDRTLVSPGRVERLTERVRENRTTVRAD